MENAQTSHNHNHNNKQDQKQNMTMQKKGMMQDMMNQNMPMEKYMMMVNQLPNMQQQLSLSDMQMEQLNDLQAGFKKQQIDFQSELQKKQAKLKSLLDDMAPVSYTHLGESRSFTFGELKEISDRTAGFFSSIGIRKGDMVMVILKRRA